MISARQKMILKVCLLFVVIEQLLFITLFSTSRIFCQQRDTFLTSLQSVYTNYYYNDATHTLADHNLTTMKAIEYSTIMAEIPFTEFKYPPNHDYRGLVRHFMEKGHLDIPPLNAYRYQYLSFAKDKCKPSSRVFLLILVKSAVANFQRRQNIRETWGNESIGAAFMIKTVFLLGGTTSAFIQSRVDDENRLYRDIVQIDFIDNYYNNTLKTYGGFTWIQQQCNHAKFVLTVDDDYFVAPERIVNYLSMLKPHESQGLFMGKMGNNLPQRGNNKWRISLSEYPFDLYPPFISGGATLISRQVALEINIVMPYTKLFKLDDVYLGIILYKLGRKPRGNNFMLIRRFNATDQHEARNVLAAHGYAEDLLETWKVHINL